MEFLTSHTEIASLRNTFSPRSQEAGEMVFLERLSVIKQGEKKD